jgi:hypothetical protein
MKKLLFFLFLSLILISPTTTFAGGLNVPENLEIDKVECIDSKVYVYIKWDTAAGATSYKYYVREASGKFSDRGDEISDTQYKAGLSKNFDHYIAISSVNTFYGSDPANQKTESEKSKELEITKEYMEKQCKSQEKTDTNEEVKPSITPTTKPTYSISTTPKVATQEASPAPTSDSAKLEADKKMAQMQKKIETLEKKVEQSDKKISGLEKTIQSMKKFISSIFSFNK